MIITISIFIYLFFKPLQDNANYLNLFHKSNKLKSLIIFTLEGLFYLFIYYNRIKKQCKNIIITDLLLLMGIFSILLGISLFLIRLVNITFYIILFILVMTLIISGLFISMKFNYLESFNDKCYLYSKKNNNECITIPKYKNKCISKDYILNNNFSDEHIELNNIKNKLMLEKLDIKKQELEKKNCLLKNSLFFHHTSLD